MLTEIQNISTIAEEMIVENRLASDQVEAKLIRSFTVAS